MATLYEPELEIGREKSCVWESEENAKLSFTNSLVDWTAASRICLVVACLFIVHSCASILLIVLEKSIKS